MLKVTHLLLHHSGLIFSLNHIQLLLLIIQLCLCFLEISICDGQSVLLHCQISLKEAEHTGRYLVQSATLDCAESKGLKEGTQSRAWYQQNITQ